MPGFWLQYSEWPLGERREGNRRTAISHHIEMQLSVEECNIKIPKMITKAEIVIHPCNCIHWVCIAHAHMTSAVDCTTRKSGIKTSESFSLQRCSVHCQWRWTSNCRVKHFTLFSWLWFFKRRWLTVCLSLPGCLTNMAVQDGDPQGPRHSLRTVTPKFCFYTPTQNYLWARISSFCSLNLFLTQGTF